MPALGGFEMLGQLSKILPKISVAVVISSSVAKEDMKRAFALGAMGYIPKSSASDVMEKALQRVLSGGGASIGVWLYDIDSSIIDNNLNLME